MFFHAATQVFVEKMLGVCGFAAQFAEKLCFSVHTVKFSAAMPLLPKEAAA
ncbi:MAG: hypothetical protein ABL952_09635 [Pyrinomonadaceae bacterium]